MATPISFCISLNFYFHTTGHNGNKNGGTLKSQLETKDLHFTQTLCAMLQSSILDLNIKKGHQWMHWPFKLKNLYCITMS
jgi:hypothetical protein